MKNKNKKNKFIEFQAKLFKSFEELENKILSEPHFLLDDKVFNLINFTLKEIFNNKVIILVRLKNREICFNNNLLLDNNYENIKILFSMSCSVSDSSKNENDYIKDEKLILYYISNFNGKEKEIIKYILKERLSSVLNILFLKKKELEIFNSFTKAIMVIFKYKSRHTFNHCQRVPVIAKKIAEKINEKKEGKLKNINFDSFTLYQIELGSWLHDIGKLAIKDSILEKSKRLESFINMEDSILDRIELFKAQSRKREYTSWLNILKEAIKKSNKGQNISLKEKIIVKKCQRFFYNSNNERKPLLKDKEVEALCLNRGTLTREEVEIMKSHVKIGKEVLNSIYMPEYLDKVKNISIHHHEKLDGSGYPFGKKSKDLTYEERLLSVADILEALLSDDRPYKKPLSNDEIEKILTKMAHFNFLDKDIVNLVIENKDVFLISNKIQKNIE